DTTWRRNWRFVSSDFMKKRPKITHNLETVYDRANIAINHFSKSAIASQKLCELERKSQFITNRKSTFAFHIPTLDLTCNATHQRNRRYVTSGFMLMSLESRITWKLCI